MRIALIQTNIEYGNPEKNMNHVEELIKKSISSNPDIIILPEMWNTSYALKKLNDIADREGKPCAMLVSKLAKENNVNIIAGSVADKNSDKMYNTSYVFNREGKNVAKYSKVHLFKLIHEEAYMTQGVERVCFDLDDIKCGIIICYDLRFPELTRKLVLDGAKILFIPAQWPKPKLDTWRTLIQARAIENQMFVVAVNRVGKEKKAEFFGHSMVVDPLGQIIAEGTEEEEVIIADINLQQVDDVRGYMTCLEDRVTQVYD